MLICIFVTSQIFVKKLQIKIRTKMTHRQGVELRLSTPFLTGPNISLLFLTLLLVWTAEFSKNSLANRIGPYTSVLGKSRCACWSQSLDGS